MASSAESNQVCETVIALSIINVMNRVAAYGERNRIAAGLASIPVSLQYREFDCFGKSASVWHCGPSVFPPRTIFSVIESVFTGAIAKVCFVFGDMRRLALNRLAAISAGCEALLCTAPMFDDVGGAKGVQAFFAACVVAFSNAGLKGHRLTANGASSFDLSFFEMAFAFLIAKLARVCLNPAEKSIKRFAAMCAMGEHLRIITPNTVRTLHN